MSNISSEDGVKGGKIIRIGQKEREERGMEHSIDYLIMHFIISVTKECLLSLAARPTSAAGPPFNEVENE